MTTKITYSVNIICTVLTCIMILLFSISCTEGQVEDTQMALAAANTVAIALPAPIKATPVYLYGMIALDITSSLAAAYMSYLKTKNITTQK